MQLFRIGEQDFFEKKCIEIYWLTRWFLTNFFHNNIYTLLTYSGYRLIDI